MVAWRPAVEFTGLPLWHRAGLPPAPGAWRRLDIEIEAIDETNCKVQVEDLARSIEAADAGMVMLVGVQSNQFPRALDIASHFAQARHPGRDRRLPRLRDARHARRDAIPRVQASIDLGVSVFAGEAEGRLEAVLQRRVRGSAAAALQLHGRSAGHLEGAAAAVPAGRSRSSVTGRAPRASTPGAAARINARSAPSSTCRAASRAAAAPTISSGHSRQRGAGDPQLLHHRRQFRAQQGLGIDPRPHHRLARGGEAGTQLHRSRSIRSATSCRTSSRSAPRRACKRVSSGSRTSTRTI